MSMAADISGSPALYPPRVAPPSGPLPVWRFLPTFLRNPLRTLPLSKTYSVAVLLMALDARYAPARGRIIRAYLQFLDRARHVGGRAAKVPSVHLSEEVGEVSWNGGRPGPQALAAADQRRPAGGRAAAGRYDAPGDRGGV